MTKIQIDGVCSAVVRTTETDEYGASTPQYRVCITAAPPFAGGLISAKSFEFEEDATDHLASFLDEYDRDECLTEGEGWWQLIEPGMWVMLAAGVQIIPNKIRAGMSEGSLVVQVVDDDAPPSFSIVELENGGTE